MLKLLGALLLMGCGLALGLDPAGELRRRAAALEGWRGALELMGAELEFSLPPMGELLVRSARGAPEPVRRGLDQAAEGLGELGERPFSDIWIGALESCAPPLTREDLELLGRLGSVLGRYDGQSQRQTVERVAGELAARERRLREELRRSGKAWIATGLSLGAFAAILLL